MNKKGNYIVLAFIGLALAVILFANLVLPTTDDLYSTQGYTESLTLLNGTAVSTTYNLTSVTAIRNTTGTLDTGEYSVDADADTITLVNPANNNTALSVQYEYYASTYLNSASERSLAGVLGIAVLVGIIYAGLVMLRVI